MKWEGGHMPPIPSPLGAFECGSIFNIYQHYLGAIPTKFLVLNIITSKILISFAVWLKSLGGKGVGVIYRPPTLLISHI